MSDQKTKILAIIIISTAVVLAITSVWNDSLVVDEIPHIGAGYSYLTKQELRLNPEHPPLAKDLAAIPLLFLKLKQTVFETKFWQSDVNGQWEFGRNLIYNSGNDANLITRFAKLPMLLFFVLAAVLIFKWGKKLYGNAGGLIALALFSFSPTILAHSRFVTTDVPALFGILASTYFFLKYLQQNSRKNFWLAGIAFGIALLTKFSTFLLVPYFLILALVWGLIDQRRRGTLFASHGRFRNDGHKVCDGPLRNPCSTAETKTLFTGAFRYILKTILIFVVGVILVVWPVYFFHTYRYPSAHQKADTVNLLQSYGNRPLANTMIWASDKPGIRALAGYGLGLLMVNQRAAGGNTTYFLGEVSRFGWRNYFPIVYFIKEPLAWWGLVLVAIFTVIGQLTRGGVGTFHRLSADWQTSSRDYFLKNHFTEFAMILWIFIYWYISINSTLNIGVRHLLPTYPFAILLVSGQLSRILAHLKKTSARSLVFVPSFLIFSLLAWYVVENIRTYPFYLTYFNQTVGGPSGGHNYVVDSNLDWGQDLKRFSQWVEKNNLPKIELDYFGWAEPSYYLGNTYEKLSSQKYKSAEDFRARNQTDGWLAVSATFLEGSQGPPDQFKPVNYLWLKSYQPVTTIGHSIFIYRIK